MRFLTWLLIAAALFATSANHGKAYGSQLRGRILVQESTEYTTVHNTARRAVFGNRGPLVWNLTLYGRAKAESNRLARNCSVFKPTFFPYGGSAFAVFYTRLSGNPYNTPTKIVNHWLQQKASYNPATNTCAAGAKCRNYLQIVWFNTKRFACATSTCTTYQIDATQKGNASYSICLYDPPGNIAGQRPYPL